jgi:hypothetical protein
MMDSPAGKVRYIRHYLKSNVNNFDTSETLREEFCLLGRKNFMFQVARPTVTNFFKIQSLIIMFVRFSYYQG